MHHPGAVDLSGGVHRFAVASRRLLAPPGEIGVTAQTDEDPTEAPRVPGGPRELLGLPVNADELADLAEHEHRSMEVELHVDVTANPIVPFGKPRNCLLRLLVPLHALLERGAVVGLCPGGAKIVDRPVPDFPSEGVTGELLDALDPAIAG